MLEPDPREEDLLALLRRQVGRYDDKTFITFGDGESLSYAAFGRRVDAFRSHLMGLGIQPGERVALMMKNSLFYPVTWIGTLAAGAVAVPVNRRLGEADARYVFEHSGAAALVVDDSIEAVARRRGSPRIRRVIVGSAGDASQGGAAGSDMPAPPLQPGSLANIQYTSGTTGFPKGCLLTHRYWQRMGAATVEAMGITEDDTLLTSQPHSYIDPQWNVIATLRAGAHLVLLDGFHPTTFMSDVARFGVSVFYCLGVMPTLLLKQPPAPHDRRHSLERVYCSAIPVEQHAAIEERWGVPWFEAFGMTESGMNIAVSPNDHDRLVGSACLGRVLPHNEAMIVDQDDGEVVTGTIGELVLRGLGFMEGYHDDPQATADFFRNGWAHTGDFAERDTDGLIYYRGRRKEMIRRGGENISPVEIETTLTSHRAVVECAVAPVPDQDVGEEIKAYVVCSRDADIDAPALAAYLLGKIASFKVPRYWELRDSLPHTQSEKVAKHELERGRDSFMLDTVDLKPKAVPQARTPPSTTKV